MPDFIKTFNCGSSCPWVNFFRLYQ